MCGITGWVDFRRPTDEVDRAHQPDLDGMVATMACRGPDDAGTWSDGRAALGHRRLSVIDLPGGAQPMALDAEGRPLAALCYSGEVYNYLELRRDLEAVGEHFTTRSDTEVVLRGYARWGTAVVERLNGMFAFAVWDPRTGTLLLARDRMGIKPLYWYPTPHGLLFGSEPKAILAHPSVSATVDADGLRELLTMVKTPEAAAYRGMREVRPGQLVVCRAEGTTTHRYWKLEAREHTAGVDQTVTEVRRLLDDIVGRQLIADVPLCSLLSGGLDSSAVTALAAGQLAEGGRGAVRSFAVDFVGYEDKFQPDSMRDTPDTPFVHELAEYVHAEHRDIVLSTEDLMAPDLRHDALHAADLPTARGDMFTSLLSLFRAIRGESTVALSGESADEVFGGYRWFHDPEAVAADTFPWMVGEHGSMSQRFDGPDTLLAPGLLADLDLGGYRDQSYRDALAEVPHVEGADPHERRMREICYLHLTRFVQYLLDRKDRMSMATGLEVRVPFCDHRLVEYVFNTPWSQKTFDGREKSLLRAATADVLPASIVERKKSPYPSTQDPSYEQALRRSFVAAVSEPDAPVLDLVDRDRVHRLVAAGEEGVDWGTLRPQLELVLALNAWMADYGVSLEA